MCANDLYGFCIEIGYLSIKFRAFISLVALCLSLAERFSIRETGANANTPLGLALASEWSMVGSVDGGWRAARQRQAHPE